jgi:hypothetical protein
LLPELIVVFIVEALDRCVLCGSVHSLDLTGGRRVLRVGSPMKRFVVFIRHAVRKFARRARLRADKKTELRK